MLRLTKDFCDSDNVRYIYEKSIMKDDSIIHVKRQQLYPRAEDFDEEWSYSEKTIAMWMYTTEWLWLELLHNLNEWDTMEVVHWSEIKDCPHCNIRFVWTEHKDYED